MNELIKKYKGKIDFCQEVINMVDTTLTENKIIDEGLVESLKTIKTDYTNIKDVYESVIRDLEGLKK